MEENGIELNKLVKTGGGVDSLVWGSIVNWYADWRMVEVFAVLSPRRRFVEVWVTL